MKKILVILLILYIASFCGCTSQSEADINEFIKIYNSGNVQPINAKDFRIKKDGKRYRYSYIISEKTMLCLYAESNGVIKQCSVTALSDSKDFFSVCSETTRAFTGKNIDETNKAVKAAFEKTITIDNFKLTLIDVEAGKTFLINYESDELNTNEHPTLKKYIAEEDVSRPTLRTENNTSETN